MKDHHSYSLAAMLITAGLVLSAWVNWMLGLGIFLCLWGQSISNKMRYQKRILPYEVATALGKAMEQDLQNHK